MKFEGSGIGSWGSVSEHAAQAAPRMDVGAGMVGEVSAAGAVAAATVVGGAVAPSANKATEDAGEKLAAEMKVFNDAASAMRDSLNGQGAFSDRVSSLMLAAADLFGLAPTWTAFYREVLGAEGLMRKAVEAGEEMAAFECSAEHAQLLEMLTALRSRDLPENDPFEQQRMITVRIPKSLHDSICAEANALSVSVNKLCISRLLQKVDPAMIPASGQKRRGRRPGGAASKSAGAVVETQVISGQMSANETGVMFGRAADISPMMNPPMGGSQFGS